MAIKFGTEGWRALMTGEFTIENVRRVSQAIAEHFLSTSHSSAPTLAVGYDVRAHSEEFATAVCEVLTANTIKTILSNRSVPTCAVSRYVVDHRLGGGIVITASHNPPSYNGIKVKEAFGGSATTETVASIESRLGCSPKRLAFAQARKRLLVRRADFLSGFLAGIRAFIDLAAIRRSRVKALVDSMHGTGGRLIERLLRGGRCRIETLHPEADPLFGGQAPEPIASHLTELAKRLKSRRWNVGIATDGDADRLGIIAPGGVFLNPGQVLCIVADYLITIRQRRGAIVKTVSNTSMIHRLGQAHGLDVIEVPVGFKHIAKLMLDGGVLIGGEESGGIGVHGYLPERDGVLMGLLVLEAMAVQGRGILELLRGLERRLGRWAYARRDLTVSPARVSRFFERLRRSPPTKIAGTVVSEVNAVDGVKLIGSDESWLLFRRSGTEPIVRVYAESPHTGRVNRLLAFGVKLVNSV
ncbi:MAG: phosphoglucomutase/phosphomannomutase family protein [Candidatus Omnitrophica bacterium]|nr:phosphoglucomutase/phosphomannomutase family protein [Candidatus Omnitrophota bacterium]